MQICWNLYAIFFDSRDIDFDIFRFLTVWDNSVMIFDENLRFFYYKNYSMKSISDNGIPFFANDNRNITQSLYFFTVQRK
jgi:hypothetical protein